MTKLASSNARKQFTLAAIATVHVPVRAIERNPLTTDDNRRRLGLPPLSPQTQQQQQGQGGEG